MPNCLKTVPLSQLDIRMQTNQQTNTFIYIYIFSKVMLNGAVLKDICTNINTYFSIQYFLSGSSLWIQSEWIDSYGMILPCMYNSLLIYMHIFSACYLYYLYHICIVYTKLWFWVISYIFQVNYYSCIVLGDKYVRTCLGTE